MDLTPLIPEDRHVVDGFAAGLFVIRGVRVSGAVFVFPDRVIAWDSPPAFEALTLDDFRPVFDAPDRPEFLLLGTGPLMRFPSKALRLALRGAGLTVEAMDSRAACRTHNVLLAEGRSFASALLPL